jgi:molybdenum cofactor cytidylyltransferase
MADEVTAAIRGLDVTLVANPDYATGLASSLRAGIRAVPEECAGALVLLGDMPRITAAHIAALVGAFASAPDCIVVPVREGRQGNPVIWPRGLFLEMLQLDGDAGAKRLIAAHRGAVREIETATDAIFVDVDTPEALRDLRGEAD